MAIDWTGTNRRRSRLRPGTTVEDGGAGLTWTRKGRSRGMAGLPARGRKSGPAVAAKAVEASAGPGQISPGEARQGCVACAKGRGDWPVARTGKCPATTVAMRSFICGWRIVKATRVTAAARRPDDSVAAQVVTTILPPAVLSSMARCAATISSMENVMPMGGMKAPASTASTTCWSGVDRKSPAPPE